LYLDNSTTSLANAPSKAEIIKAARAHVRARGGQVIVHLQETRETDGAAH